MGKKTVTVSENKDIYTCDVCGLEIPNPDYAYKYRESASFFRWVICYGWYRGRKEKTGETMEVVAHDRCIASLVSQITYGKDHP